MVTEGSEAAYVVVAHVQYPNNNLEHGAAFDRKACVIDNFG